MRKVSYKIIGFVLVLIVIILVAFSFFIKDGDRGQEVRMIDFPDKFSQLRYEMVEEQLKKRDIDNEIVLQAMGNVERHKLVPEDIINKAYIDFPLPIGYGQTISQPYIVALMTQAAGVKKGDKVLEIGTGSGYQAAVLAEIVEQVYSIEIVKELAATASQNLAALGYENIEVKNADGYYGWAEAGPFDAILVTAAANHVPPLLIDQLKDGGRLVIPLGNIFRFQTLNLITKKDNEVTTEYITGVTFVEMTGQVKE